MTTSPAARACGVAAENASAPARAAAMRLELIIDLIQEPLGFDFLDSLLRDEIRQCVLGRGKHVLELLLEEVFIPLLGRIRLGVEVVRAEVCGRLLNRGLEMLL